MSNRFKDFLLEIGNSAGPFTVIEDTDSSFSTQSIINGRSVVFSATLDDPGEMHIEFWELTDNDSTKKIHALSGSGGEIKVMAMIGSSLKAAVAKHSPDLIFFTAEDYSEKRAEIYERLLRKYLPKYETVRSDSGKGIDFQVKKIK